MCGGNQRSVTMALADDVRTFRAAASGAATPDRFEPRNWSEQDWMRLFERATPVRYPAGEPFLRRGDADRAVYFLVRGRAEVFTSDADSMSIGPLSEIVPGSVVGEAAFFDGKPRSASVWAVETCDALSLSAEQFAGFDADHPRLARDVLHALGVVLAARLRSANERVAH
jgi:CRP/FNR family transcriptional regulator, cyclic AMP receptor protein